MINLLLIESPILKSNFNLLAENSSIQLYQNDSNIQPSDVNAIYSRLKYKLDCKFLKKYTNLRYIIMPTTGLTHIELDYCQNNNIDVLSLKGETKFLSTIYSTSELCWSLVLNLSRKTNVAINDVAENNWNRTAYNAVDLNEKIMGILGMGRLGKKCAEYASVFGMKVKFFDINKSVEVSSDYERVSLNNLFETSDFLSIHIEGCEKNRNFVNQSYLKLMKKTSYLINTSRGMVINEEDLLLALDRNFIAGAALDVLEGEDNSLDLETNKLINYSKKNKNLIITPHIGGATFDSMCKTEKYVIQKLLKEISCEQ